MLTGAEQVTAIRVVLLMVVSKDRLWSLQSRQQDQTHEIFCMCVRKKFWISLLSMDTICSSNFDVINEIIRTLTLTDIFSLLILSKKWHKSLTNDFFWKAKFSTKQQKKKPQDMSFFRFYQTTRMALDLAKECMFALREVFLFSASLLFEIIIITILLYYSLFNSHMYERQFGKFHVFYLIIN